MEEMELEITNKVSLLNIVNDDEDRGDFETKTNEEPEYKTNEELEAKKKEIEEQFIRLKLMDENERKEMENHKEKLQRKELLTKVKFISLDKLNIDPMINTYNLNKTMKAKLNEVMYQVMEYPEEYIDKEFNRIANQAIFDKTNDYSQFAVYSNF